MLDFSVIPRGIVQRSIPKFNGSKEIEGGKEVKYSVPMKLKRNHEAKNPYYASIFEAPIIREPNGYMPVLPDSGSMDVKTYEELRGRLVKEFGTPIHPIYLNKAERVRVGAINHYDNPQDTVK